MKKGSKMKRKPKQPERTRVFRITPEGRPRIWRIVELRGKHTLHQLHAVLYQAFELKGKHIYAFFLSGKAWDGNTEYGGPSSGSSRKANKAELGRLNLERGRPFLYVYNFDKEQRFTIEWTEDRETEPKVSYPHILETEGILPPPEPPIEDSLPSPLKTLVQKLKPSLHTWNLARSKPRGPKDVQAARVLLTNLYKQLDHGGQEAWCLLEEATSFLLVDWLLSLPSDLAKRGFTEDAFEVCNFFSAYADETYFLCERALLFADMGRKEKSLQQVRENITRFPDNPRVVAKAAEAFWRLQEVGHAERLFRRALDLAAEDINERERILEKLIAMLEENERTEEAIELVQSELDRG